jgi:hypothetical protein
MNPYPALILTFICLLSPQILTAEELQPLNPGGQPLKIVFEGIEKVEADKLQGSFAPVLEKMTGLKPQVVGVSSPEGLVFRQKLDASAPEDAFQIRTQGNRVEITASAPIGLRFGFYELMERLGCRFWSWDEEVIPSLPVVNIGNIDYAWKPAFAMHDLMNQEAMTRKNDFVHKLRAVSPRQFTGNHNIQVMLKKFAEANPKEVYPLVKIVDKATKQVTGEKREFNNLHFCYTAPGISEALAVELEKEVVKRKGDLKHFIYFAGMGDWYGGICECERCKKIYEEEAWVNPDGKRILGVSATLLMMINKTAEILDAKYPGIEIGTFAYMSLEAPPGKTVPRSNVSIYIPRLRHSGNTAANDPSGNNRQFWLNLERWCELAPGRVDIWEYGANYKNFLYPYPVIYTMAENIKAYKKIGVRGLMIQGNYASMGSDAVVMNNWVWSRLMSDPSRDTESLVKEFTDGYYGPAAPEVREYLKILEASVKYPGAPNIDEFSDALATYLTKEVQEKLTARIKAAKDLVSSPENSVFLPRINDLAIGVEAARLWKKGPFKERDGRYIRVDFGEDTYDQAMQLWKNNRRNTTPDELNSGRQRWLDFLAMHGGPVATLQEGDMRIKIWPANNGQIGPVMLGPVPVILSSYDHALRFAEFEPALDAKSSRLFGDAGVGPWDPDTKHLMKQEIRPLDGTSFKVDFFTQRVSKAPTFRSAMHVVTTTYPIKVSSPDLAVSYLDAAGVWQKVSELPGRGKAKQIKLEGVFGWRIGMSKILVADEYSQIATVPGSPKYNTNRPHMSGWLQMSDDGNLTTVNNIQVDEIDFDKEALTLHRVVKIERQ